MSDWKQSEKDTRELREVVDCPPDACVYRCGELMAVVYCGEPGVSNWKGDGSPTWHLYVASYIRPPEIQEVVEARLALLPNIEDYAITPVPALRYCFHLWELPHQASSNRPSLRQGLNS